MPKFWQAMILASIWFAAKICQTLIFSLPNLWQYFCTTFGLPNVWHDKVWTLTEQAPIFRGSQKSYHLQIR
jgi:hypothetical protein